MFGCGSPGGTSAERTVRITLQSSLCFPPKDRPQTPLKKQRAHTTRFSAVGPVLHKTLLPSPPARSLYPTPLVVILKAVPLTIVAWRNMSRKAGDMKRIAIIGSPGAGKSTLARQLGEISGLPVFHLDRLFWKPGWIQSPKPLWIALQSALVAQDSWIIDGNYGATLQIRLAAADTAIFLDFPRYLCLGQAVKRAWQYRGTIRPDMAPGCPEKIDREFLRYIWRFPAYERPNILSQLRLASEQGTSVIQLTGRQQMTQYIKTIER